MGYNVIITYRSCTWLLIESLKMQAASDIYSGLASTVRTKGSVLIVKIFFDSYDLPWVNEAEFLQTCRMSRKNVRKLIDKCKDHPLFEFLSRVKTVNKEKTERRARNHLMHLLCFLGTFGEEEIIVTAETSVNKDTVRMKICEILVLKSF